MRNGLLLTDNAAIARLFGEAAAGTDGAFRARNSVDNFVSEVTARPVNWVAVDLTSEPETRQWVFHRIPSAVEKFAVTTSATSISIAGSGLSMHSIRNISLPQTNFDQLRTLLGFSNLQKSAATEISKPQMILIDPEVTRLNEFTHEFDQRGWQIDRVAPSKDLFTEIKTKQISCFILGCQTKFEEDVSLARILKRTPATHNIPIMFLVGEISKDTLAAVSSAGVDDILLRRSSVKQIADRVEALLTKRATHA